MDKLVVVDGSNLIFCTAGHDPSVLKVTSCNTPPVNGSRAATIQDHVSHDNVKPFGKCTLTGRRCDPQTPKPWLPGAEDVIAGEVSASFPTLTENSFLNCTEGGIVQIANAGQNFYKIGSDYELVYDEEGRLVGFARLHDGEVMSVFDTDGDWVWIRQAIEADYIFFDIALTLTGGIGIKALGKAGARLLARRAEKKTAEKIARKKLAGAAGGAAGRPGRATIDDILSQTEHVRTSKSIHRQRGGGFEQANRDFDSLPLKNMKTQNRQGLRSGELDDGTKVTVRDTPNSSGGEGKPTLEIQPPRGKVVKVRYND